MQLILRAKSVFDRIETRLKGSELDLPTLKAAVDKALPLIEDVDNKLFTELLNPSAELGEFEKNVTEVKNKLQETIDKRYLITTGGTSRCGRQRRQS